MNQLGVIYSTALILSMIVLASYLIVKMAQAGINALQKWRKK